MTNQRPTMIAEGMYRNYVNEEGMVIIEQYQNGQWVTIVETPNKDDDEEL